jgi:hypothetical protein
LSYWGDRERRMEVSGRPRQKQETLSEKKLKVKGLGVWLKWLSTLEALRSISSNTKIQSKNEISICKNVELLKALYTVGGNVKG